MIALADLTPQELDIYEAEFSTMLWATGDRQKAVEAAEKAVELDREVRCKDSPHSPEVKEHRSPLVKCGNPTCARVEAESMATSVIGQHLTDWQRDKNPSVCTKWASLVMADAFGQFLAASAYDISQPVISIRKRQIRDNWPALFELIPDYAERLRAKFCLTPENEENAA